MNSSTEWNVFASETDFMLVFNFLNLISSLYWSGRALYSFMPVYSKFFLSLWKGMFIYLSIGCCVRYNGHEYYSLQQTVCFYK